MVEQEHSKNSTVFPESLIPSKLLQKPVSNEWFMNDAMPLLKSEELCSSDLLNIELLYGSVPSTDETLCSSISNGCVKEQNDILYPEMLPNDIFSANDCTPCDLYYDDKNISYGKNYWDPMSEKISSVSDSFFEANSPLSFWGSCPLDLETLKMDEVFQVDKDDLVQSPTLAELNANDESLFDSFDNFGILHNDEQKSVKPILLTSGLNSNTMYKIPSLSEASQIKTTSETSSERTNLVVHVDSCVKDEPFSDNGGKSRYNPKESKMDSLSADLIIKSETADISSQVMAKHMKKLHSSIESSIKTEERETENVSRVLSSNNETLDSEDDDSEMDCDYSSDIDEESEEDIKIHSTKHATANNLLLQKKKSRYFWQYNLQSKGPKAPKVKLDGKVCIAEDFSGITDPVFTSNYYIKGIKHAGKARRGDGNDLTPNPEKLYNIGLELEKLTSVIEGLIPANELPLNARSKSRKEKNKLASRACRLKKKAQHEANKLKLYGLQKEQVHLHDVIVEVKRVVKKSVDNVKHGKIQSNVQAKIEALCMKRRYADVAGCSAEFVNNVLKRVDLGDKTGGLAIEARDD